ncbi:hypothetical protein GCM10011611_20700 [Aliidongia dinghuensis]|uniref:Uncharacterized protein n=1 Tax=Aliidongia dinghuensis TaxID=1867774 RepID=A0A8J3E1S7_9PROT|nr:hypothetical protein [Aliidongia dinghuensis]GGF14801.1 hypothetical protein GCM10011611_20700 [Aliidongia dinghuensis]
MAKCSGWYYKGPAWHQNSLVAVNADSRSGKETRKDLLGLGSNEDAKAFIGALDYIARLGIEGKDGKSRDPFGCAEPDAVYQLLKLGAEINQIFISQTRESRVSTYWRDAGEEYDVYLKPCPCCRLWLSAEHRAGYFMIDIKELYRLRDLNSKATTSDK